MKHGVNTSGNVPLAQFYEDAAIIRSEIALVSEHYSGIRHNAVLYSICFQDFARVIVNPADRLELQPGSCESTWIVPLGIGPTSSQRLPLIRSNTNSLRHHGTMAAWRSRGTVPWCHGAPAAVPSLGRSASDRKLMPVRHPGR
jgi:hypothetical protein